MARTALSATLAVLGIITFGGAIVLLIAARTGTNTDGWSDLARFVGALLLAAVAGLFFGASLIVARFQRAKLPRWLTVTAAFGSLLALVPAATFLPTALEGGNWGLAAFAVAVAAIALGGMASAPRAWRAA